jgi:hypothetical protein
MPYPSRIRRRLKLAARSGEFTIARPGMGTEGYGAWQGTRPGYHDGNNR